MTLADARARAEEAIALMNSMNASYEHIPSKDKASLAGIVLDLCTQLEAAHATIAALEAPRPILWDDTQPEPAVAAPDAHLGGVGE